MFTNTGPRTQGRPPYMSATADCPGFKSILRHERILMAAYFRAQRRGFCPGHEIEDWLEAEREVNGGEIGDSHRH